MPPSPQSRCFVRSCIALRCLYSAHASCALACRFCATAGSMGSVARADKAEVAEDGGAAADARTGGVIHVHSGTGGVDMLLAGD